MDYIVFCWLLGQFAIVAITMNLAYSDDIRNNFTLKLERGVVFFFFYNTTQVVKHLYCVHVAKIISSKGLLVQHKA